MPAPETAEPKQDEHPKASMDGGDHRKSIMSDRRKSSVAEPLGSASVFTGIDKARKSLVRRSTRLEIVSVLNNNYVFNYKQDIKTPPKYFDISFAKVSPVNYFEVIILHYLKVCLTTLYINLIIKTTAFISTIFMPKKS